MAKKDTSNREYKKKYMYNKMELSKTHCQKKTSWSSNVTRWRPWGETRSAGRLQQHGYDDIKGTAAPG